MSWLTRCDNFFCPLLVLLFASVVTVQGAIVRYNPTTKQLHLRCPGEPIRNGRVHYIRLSRERDDATLANWTRKSDPHGVAIYDRVQLQPATDPDVLEVVLRHVTCHDVATYVCNMNIEWQGNRVPTIDRPREPFFFEGEISKPVMTVEPKQEEPYRAGDILRMTCEARIGGANNTFVWETKLPGEHFAPLTADKCVKGTNITDRLTSESESKACGVTSVSTVTHMLTSDDDGREWRCKLQKTNNYTAFVTAVKCLRCAEAATPRGGLPTGRAVAVSPTTQSTPKGVPTALETRVHQAPVEADEVHHIIFILIGVICLLFVALFVSIIVMVTTLRKRNCKEHQVSVSIPAAQASDFRSQDSRTPRPCNSSRSLPRPPIQYQYPIPEDYAHDMDRSSLPRLDKDDSQRHLCAPPSSSVYVSMSAVPSLHEENTGDSQWTPVRPRNEDGGGPQQDRRSESIYSNCETQTTKVSNGSVGSHDSRVVTMGNLKGWMS